MNNEQSFECLFCASSFFLNSDTLYSTNISFDGVDIHPLRVNTDSSFLSIYFLKCPSCKKISVKLIGKGPQYPDNRTYWFFPQSSAKQFPDYVPQQIREDYEEAFKILHLSPKASATLSRRCLQGIVRDVWKVTPDTLYNEIGQLKPKIDPTLWQTLDSLRQLGNIGAHMEKNVNLIINIDSDEAEKLVKLIEILIKDWYIVPHERNLLLQNICTINADKQNQRKSSPPEDSSS